MLATAMLSEYSIGTKSSRNGRSFTKRYEIFTILLNTDLDEDIGLGLIWLSYRLYSPTEKKNLWLLLRNV